MQEDRASYALWCLGSASSTASETFLSRLTLSRVDSQLSHIFILNFLCASVTWSIGDIRVTVTWLTESEENGTIS